MFLGKAFLLRIDVVDVRCRVKGSAKLRTEHGEHGVSMVRLENRQAPRRPTILVAILGPAANLIVYAN